LQVRDALAVLRLDILQVVGRLDHVGVGREHEVLVRGAGPRRPRPARLARRLPPPEVEARPLGALAQRLQGFAHGTAPTPWPRRAAFRRDRRPAPAVVNRRRAPALRPGARRAPQSIRSTMIAGAMPPPAHIVTSPRFLPWRSSSSTMVPISIEPVAPIGWPSAIAPPLTLTFSRSSPRSRITFSTTTANAS